MKEAELRQHLTCRLCHQPIGQAGPVFYRLRVEQYVVDVANVQRQAGLAALLGGSAALAHEMGDDQDMAHQVVDSEPFAVCMTCACDPDSSLPVAVLMERGYQDGDGSQEAD